MESQQHIIPFRKAGVSGHGSPPQRAACAMGRITRAIFVNQQHAVKETSYGHTPN